MNFAERFVIQSAAIESQKIPPSVVATTGHMTAYRTMLAIADSGDDLRQSDLKGWQRLIGAEQQLWGDFVLPDDDLGQYRNHPVYVGGRAGTEWAKIDGEMNALWPLVNGGEWDNAVALNIAAVVHYRYERIHPFADGNGRSGRLLATYILRRAKVPPVLFTNADKQQTYYPAFDPSSPDRMIAYFRSHQMKSWD